MSVFTVVISKPMRKGSEPLIMRHVESSTNSYEVQKYFNNLYNGFIVAVTAIQNIDIINIELKELKEVKEERKVAETIIKVIKGKEIKLTKEEIELYKNYVTELDISLNTKRALRSSIKKRLEQLLWIANINMEDIKVDNYARKSIEITEIRLTDNVISYFEETVNNNEAGNE